MNPLRPHPFQISDSTLTVRQIAGSWCVVEDWRHIDSRGEKMDMDRVLHWAETQAQARAWLEANPR